jgi:hypothetical protein
VAAYGSRALAPSIFFKDNQLREIAPGVNARSLYLSADNSRSGSIWCATVGSGLVRVSLDDQFGAIVSRFDIEQGLLRATAVSQVVQPPIRRQRRSYRRYKPRDCPYEPGMTKPTVAARAYHHRRIHQHKRTGFRLHLDYPQNSLLLDVTAISSRTFPEQFQYAFALYDSTGKIIRQKLSHDSQFPMEQLGRENTKSSHAPSRKISRRQILSRLNSPWRARRFPGLHRARRSVVLALIASAWGYVQNRRIHRTSAELAVTNRDLAGSAAALGERNGSRTPSHRALTCTIRRWPICVISRY